MKNAKKILSIILAVVLVLSTMAVAGFALETEDASKINVKYTVSQTNSLVDAASGTAYDISDTAYAGDVYAVTISVKAAYGISYLQVPFFYNQDKFGQVTLFDGADVYYSYNGYSSDMGEEVVYMYDLGPAWDDAGQYKFDGSTAANALQTKCFGLAHASGKGAYTITAKTFDQTTMGYDAWTAGISKDFNVAGGYVTLSHALASKTKAAFLNVVNGKVVTDSYVDVITFYVYNHSGDPIGEEIGAYVDYAKDSTTNIQTVWDAAYGTGTTPRNGFADGNSLAKPWVSFVENGTIAKAAAPELSISWFKNQIRFDLDKEGAYANQFDYRIVGQFDNFDDIFADLNDADARITDVGYVFTNSEVMDVNAAKAQVEGGEVVYSQVTDCYVSTSFDGTDYAFACFVSNIADNNDNKAATLYGLGYVIYENADGVTSYAYYDATLDVGTLYNQYK